MSELLDYDALLLRFIQDPDDVEINWGLGLWYHALGQTASAVSFYIRAAERASDKLLQYECMIRAGMCFDTQGIRKFSVKGMMQHAITLCPERPEAYYLLGKITSNENNDGSWFESYTWASLGIVAADNSVPDLRTEVDYPGKHVLEIQRAAAAWWCGLCEYARDEFLRLNADPEFPAEYRDVLKTNMQMFNTFYSHTIVNYDSSKHENLKIQFPGSQDIDTNYSESYQDMFVLSMHNGKQAGTYLEIGGGNATYGNNTYLLEKDFAWTGVSLEIDTYLAATFKGVRKNPCLVRDATNTNYSAFIPSVLESDVVDYLQIDCEPAHTTYEILLSIPFESFSFGVITYEHDHYTDPDNSYRERSRQLLESHGYVLVAGNISPDRKERPYEDWWAHPDYVNKQNLETLMQTSDQTKMAEDYMLGKTS